MFDKLKNTIDSLRAETSAIKDCVRRLEQRPIPRDGAEGRPGRNGLDGKDGKSPDPQEVAHRVLAQLPPPEKVDYRRVTEECLARMPSPRDGKDGAPGRDGKDGPALSDVCSVLLPQIPKPKNGKDGLPGERGLPGARGPAGKDGANGKSITSVEVDKQNRVIVGIDNVKQLAGQIQLPLLGGESGGGGVAAFNFAKQNAFDNAIIVKSITQLTEAPIDSSKVYYIDGNFTFNTTITVPVGGLVLQGLDALKSSLIYTGSGTAFQSAEGGCGSVVFEKVTLGNPVPGSKLVDLTGATGAEFFTTRTVLIFNSQDYGEITDFSGLLSINCARIAGKPSLTLSGTWNTLNIDSLFANSLDGDFAGALLQQGTNLSFSSRAIIVPSCDLPANAALCDFSGSVFTEEASFLIRNGRVTRNGAIAENGAVIPNTSESSLTSLWRNNVGVASTYPGGQLEITTAATTVISTASTKFDLAGTWTASELQHFSQSANNRLEHDGEAIRNFTLNFNATVSGSSGDSITIHFEKWDDSGSTFVTIGSQTREILNLQGSNDLAFFSKSVFVDLTINDYIKIQVSNNSGARNVTAQVGGILLITER